MDEKIAGKSGYVDEHIEGGRLGYLGVGNVTGWTGTTHPDYRIADSYGIPYRAIHERVELMSRPVALRTLNAAWSIGGFLAALVWYVRY